jgi:hypothetical protein
MRVKKVPSGGEPSSNDAVMGMGLEARRVVSEDFSETPKQRVERFRGFAAKARASAAKSSSPLEREEFLRIAHEWDAMADSIMSGVGQGPE